MSRGAVAYCCFKSNFVRFTAVRGMPVLYQRRHSKVYKLIYKYTGHKVWLLGLACCVHEFSAQWVTRPGSNCQTWMSFRRLFSAIVRVAPVELNDSINHAATAYRVVYYALATMHL